MSDDYQRIEVITGTARRRRWTSEQKLRIIEETYEPGESVSAVARRHGVAANLVFRWRRLMDEGGSIAVSSDETVVGNSEVRKLEDRVRDLERLLGRKTMEVEILKDALDRAESKNGPCDCCRSGRTVRCEADRGDVGRVALQPA